ncbi:hypothetical protein [Candidatus Paracaedibacter symbiosus]|uniref:hypothetical protein n=1 Tax=Candidatus Paracaedibacter symbiosus TaxID=244582 RepID=UPI0018DBB2FB|nr:hypothetical protein [Candidatus Paracaedibacter symbiosus]
MSNFLVSLILGLVFITNTQAVMVVRDGDNPTTQASLVKTTTHICPFFYRRIIASIV